MRPRPAAATFVAWCWGALMALGLIAGAIETVRTIGTIAGGGFPSQIGLSIGAGGIGFLAFRGLLRGRHAAWKTVRRIAWIATPLFLIAALLIGFLDPESLTVSGMGAERQLDASTRWMALVGALTGAGFFGVQLWILGQPEVRAFYADSHATAAMPRHR